VIISEAEANELIDILCDTYIDAGVAASAENLLSWCYALKELPMAGIRDAIAAHRAERPGKFPNLDDIRERVLGDSRTPYEKLLEVASDQGARLAIFERRSGKADDPIGRIMREPKKPVQLALFSESETPIPADRKQSPGRPMDASSRTATGTAKSG
jgi:hypothetical protein